MLALANMIVLEPELSRVYFKCTVCDEKQTILFDTGSPNTVITLKLAKILGLKSVSSKKVKIHLAGRMVDVVPVTLPELTMGSLKLTNVRAYAGLDSKWGNTVLLGLNVLNHLVHTVSRSSKSGFINLELNPDIDYSAEEVFNRLISNDGKYYMSGGDEKELEVII